MCIDDLGRHVGIDGRNVRKYLETLEEVGYTIVKDEKHRYFIELPEMDTPSKFGFSKPMDMQILLSVADNLIHVQRARIIQRLTQAIDEQKQVILRPYHSASEQSISDRIVEPYQLRHENKYLLAYEPHNGIVRPFKIDRIGSVHLTDTLFSHQRSSADLDLFGWSGETGITVKLRLSELAYRLLIEEYPHAMPCIRQISGGYLLETRVYSLKGVGRFVMGLVGEVGIVEPEGLRAYVQEQAGRVLEGC